MIWRMYLAWLFAGRAGLDPYISVVGCAAGLFVLGVVGSASVAVPSQRLRYNNRL